jgi:hypothetical protein
MCLMPSIQLVIALNSACAAASHWISHYGCYCSHGSDSDLESFFPPRPHLGWCFLQMVLVDDGNRRPKS